MRARVEASDPVCPETCWISGSVTVRVRDTEATAPLPSTTLRRRSVDVCPGSRTPAITPVAGSRVNPDGNAGPLFDHVRSGMPPVAASCWR